jgi:hypothetical protein
MTPTYPGLTDHQREVFCRRIHNELRTTSAGKTTAGCVSALSRRDRERELGFAPTVSLIIDALTDMAERGAVTRIDGPVVTIWRAVLSRTK